MELENTKNSNINKVISNHNYGKHSKQQAQNFNQELYNHLHCFYDNKIWNNDVDISETKQQYFNSLTKEEIEQQKKDLEELKELYKKENSTTEYRNKLNKYLEKYVYSKRKWEDFRESEVKHDIGHNLRLEYLVENILNEVEKTINKDNKEELKKFEQFKKDAITFAVMHDITHRGSPDFTDHESSIQFITFIKEMGSDIEYLQDILANKDFEKDEEKIIVNNVLNDETIDDKSKQYSNLISALVSLGDCVDFGRYGEIREIYLNPRKERLINLFDCFDVVLDKNLLEQLINESVALSAEMEKSFNMKTIYNATQISQLKLRENFELLTDKIPNSKTIEEFLQNYLFYQFTSKPQTNLQTQESFNAINDLRNENLFYLLKGCNLINDDIIPQKEILDNSELNNEINYSFFEIEINGIKYIVQKTTYNNEFFDSKNTINYKKFKIFKNTDKNGNIIDLNKLNTKDNINTLQEIDEKDISIIFEKTSTILIKKEKEFQLNRINKLNSFIDGLFDTELSDKIKKNLKDSIEILFNNKKSISDKFKAKEQLANILKLIKTCYKQDDKFIDHFLMLNNLCNAKNKKELKKELEYLFHIIIPRTFYQERVKELPFFEVESDKSIIARGLQIDLDKIDQNSFKTLDTLGFKTFDVYNLKKKPSLLSSTNLKNEYDNKQIGNTRSRGNITSFAIDTTQSLDEQYLSNSKESVLFVAGISEERKKIIGYSLYKGEKEVNTYKLETQDVAFAIKFKNGKIIDVFFNENFNGEFYIKKENISILTTKEKLREKILSFNTVDKLNESLAKFLNEELDSKKLIEEKKEIISEKANKYKNSQESKVFEKILLENIDNPKELNKINELIFIYYNLFKNKKENDIIIDGEFNKNLLGINEREYYNLIFYSYIELDNIDKLLENYGNYTNEQKNKIDDIILNSDKYKTNYSIKLFNAKISSGEKTINNEILIKNILCFEECDKYILTKIDNNKLNEVILKYYDKILDNNLINENVVLKIIDIVGKNLLTIPNNDKLSITKIIEKFKNKEDILLQLISILDKEWLINQNGIEKILKENAKDISCNNYVLLKIFDIVGSDWLKKNNNINKFFNIISNNHTNFDIHLSNSSNPDNDNINILSKLIKTVGSDWLEKEENLNAILDAINKNKYGDNILNDIIDIFGEKLSENKILVEKIAKDKHITYTIVEKLINNLGKNFLLENNYIDVILKNDSCNVSAIITLYNTLGEKIFEDKFIDILKTRLLSSKNVYFIVDFIYDILPQFNDLNEWFKNSDNVINIFNNLDAYEKIGYYGETGFEIFYRKYFKYLLKNNNNDLYEYIDKFYNKFKHILCNNIYLFLNQISKMDEIGEKWISEHIGIAFEDLYNNSEKNAYTLENITQFSSKLKSNKETLIFTNYIANIKNINNYSFSDLVNIFEDVNISLGIKISNELIIEYITSSLKIEKNNEIRDIINEKLNNNIKELINIRGEIKYQIRRNYQSMENYLNQVEKRKQKIEEIKDNVESIKNIIKQKYKFSNLYKMETEIDDMFKNNDIINEFEYKELENNKIEISFTLNNDKDNIIIMNFDKDSNIKKIEKKDFIQIIKNIELRNNFVNNCKNLELKQISFNNKSTELKLYDFNKKLDNIFYSINKDHCC